MIKRLIKTGLASVMHSTGAATLIGKASGARSMPLILGYHRVVEDFQAYRGRSILPMLIGVRTLERHLDWIGRHYRFVSLDEAAAYMREGERMVEPVAAVTFDDGYRDVYENAFPMLQRKGIPSAVFVVTDLVGTERVPLHDELHLLLSQAFRTWNPVRKHLRQMLQELGIPLHPPGQADYPTADAFAATRMFLQTLPQMQLQKIIDALRKRSGSGHADTAEFRSLNWEMLAEMQQAGVTVGAHTCSHAILTNEPLGRVDEEARGAKERAEQMLGSEISHFAYPDGQFNEAVVRRIAGAGYRYAYTTCHHRDSMHPDLTIPRRMLWENSCTDAGGHVSTAMLDCQLNGLFDLPRKCVMKHGV